jgi:hydroxyacylglutathione hydrolase
MQVSIIP